MKTLDRYLTGIFTKNLLIAVMSMSAIFCFQSMFTDIYDHNHPLRQILFYHWLNVPQVIVQMAPPAVLLATLLTLSGLSRTHELVACFSIGIGLKRLLSLILVVVMIVASFILVMEDRILPPVFRMRTNYYWREMEQRTDFFLDIRRDKIWYRSKNMIYNLESFDTKSKTIHGMSVYTFDDQFNLIQVVGAELAEYTPQGWKLTQGTVSVFSVDNPFPMTRAFKVKMMLISETPKDFQEIEKEVDGLRLKELYHYIERMKGAGADTKAYEVKFHSRMSLSFIPVVMCFLAVPFSLGTRREGNAAKDYGLCLVITFFYWLFYSVGLSLGTNGALPPWVAAWLPSFVFIGLATFLILRKKK